MSEVRRLRAVRLLAAWLVTIAAVLGAGHARADEPGFAWRVLSEADIKVDLIGRTIEGHYPRGEPFTEALYLDFSTDYSDSLRRAPGVVSFRQDAMCFAYPVATDVAGGCFIVWQRSPNCYDFYAVRDGEAFATVFERSLGLGWDARVWRTDAGSTCPAIPLS